MLASKSLFDLTAEDIMTREVITIPQTLSLRSAAHRLATAGVSGAPVVDETGRCVGVISKTDLVRFLDHGPHACRCSSESSLGYCADWQVGELEHLPTEAVARHMSPEVVTAPPGTPLGQLARMMHERHIHRVMIADSWGRVVGVVSSMDMLGVLASEEASP